MVRVKATEHLVKEALGASKEFVDKSMAADARERWKVRGVRMSTTGDITMTERSADHAMPG